MPTITFELSDLEAKVFEHIANNPQEWIENVVRHQVELAKDEVVVSEKQRMLADPEVTHMPSTRDAICEQATLVPASERT